MGSQFQSDLERLGQTVLVMLSGVCLVFWLSGCAGMVDAEPIAKTAAPPKPVKIPPKEPPRRELGSLWSEQSPWNDIYSDPPTWVPGDVLVVRLSKTFRMRVLRRLKREFPIRVKSKIDIDDKEKPVKVEVEPTSDALQPDDSREMHVTITETLPRHLYRIKGSETLRLGGRDPLVTFEGEIRARDIDRKNDSISSDKIMKLALELKPYGRGRDLASADDAD